MQRNLPVSLCFVTDLECSERRRVDLLLSQTRPLTFPSARSARARGRLQSPMLESARSFLGTLSARAELHVGGLAHKLEHSNPGVRKAALESVARLDEAALQREFELWRLVALLKTDDDAAVRSAANDALVSFSPTLLASMLASSGDPEVQAAAVIQLSRMDAETLRQHDLQADAFSEEAATAVLRLREEDPNLRLAAVSALGSAVPSECLPLFAPFLLRTLTDAEARVRKAGVEVSMSRCIQPSPRHSMPPSAVCAQSPFSRQHTDTYTHGALCVHLA